MAHLLITPLPLLPWLSHLGLYSVHPLEGQRLLHGQHQLGSTPGCVSALQLQPGSLRNNDAGLPEALPPGHLLLPVLPQPGALDPAGGERWAGGGGAGGRRTSIRAHLTSIRVPKRLGSKTLADSYGQEQSTPAGEKDREVPSDPRERPAGRAVTGEQKEVGTGSPLLSVGREPCTNFLASLFSFVKYLAVLLREYVPMVPDPTITVAVDSLQTDALTVLPLAVPHPGGPARAGGAGSGRAPVPGGL